MQLRIHPVAVIGNKKDIFGRYKKNSWTNWIDRLRGETMQDKYDQFLTRTNLSARILRKDPRAVLEIDLPPIKSMPEEWTTAGIAKRACVICWSSYVFKPGQDSPCGHVKKDGTLVP